MKPFELGAALDACKAVSAREGVELVMPGDVRREAVVLALAAYHRLRSGAAGWDVDHARESVSVAVPSLGVARSLLGLIPVVGEVFKALPERAGIYLAPSALRDPATLVGTVAHEIGHQRRAAAGGLLWCVAYGAAPEARAADEAACYGQDVTAQALLGGGDPDALCDACERSLERYDLDEESTVLARGVLGVARRSLRARAPMGGPVVDLIKELEALGVELPEDARVTAVPS